MKLICIYKEPIKGDGRLFPRDIRNYLASITKEDTEAHNAIMNHNNRQAEIIFSMPNRKSFAIFSYVGGNGSKRVFETIEKRIKENPNIRIGNVSIQADKVFHTDFKFTRFECGMYERLLKTPLIIAKTKEELEECIAHTKGGNVDKKWLEDYTAKKIKELIRVMARDWFGNEALFDEELENTIIAYKDLKYSPVRYKKGGVIFPAVKGTIISNRFLPNFIGYKCGMGFGELASLKEMERRSR